MAVLKPNILIFVGGSKSFGTYISKNFPGTSFGFVFFCSGMAPNGPDRPMFGPKWPKMSILGPNSYFLYQEHNDW